MVILYLFFFHALSSLFKIVFGNFYCFHFANFLSLSLENLWIFLVVLLISFIYTPNYKRHMKYIRKTANAEYVTGDTETYENCFDDK